MDKLFITVINMSLTGAFIVVMICLARLLLKRAPKVISYSLWIVVGLRLILPFSIESAYTLMPVKAQTIPIDIVSQVEQYQEQTHGEQNDAAPTGWLPQAGGTAEPDRVLQGPASPEVPAATVTTAALRLQTGLNIASCLWLTGCFGLVAYGVGAYLFTAQKVKDARHLGGTLYEADNIYSPFVLGVLNPRIFIPRGLSFQERRYVVAHEQAHIRRYDYLVKIVAFLICSLHWFNPFAWLAFALMSSDMEMSCDEHVIAELGVDNKENYSRCLLSLATDKRFVTGGFLAFGEGNMKGRVINVLGFKKTSNIFIAVAVVFALVLGVGFMTSRSGNGWVFGDDDVVAEETKADEESEWGINDDGLTYGRANDVKTIEELPDLVYVGSVNGEKGYVYSQEFISTYADHVRNNAGNGYGSGYMFTSAYKVDGKTELAVVVFSSSDHIFEEAREKISEYYTVPVIAFDFGLLSDEIKVQTKDQYMNSEVPAYTNEVYADYPVNANGQTYGSASQGFYGDHVPDLVAAMATNGKVGYIYATDYYTASRPAANPTQAAEFAAQDYEKSVNAFCEFYQNTTGKTIRYESAYSILQDFRSDMYMNKPWRKLNDEQKTAFMNLFPEGYRTLDIAEQAYQVSRDAKGIHVPVYESDGMTVIGEMVIQ